MLHEIKSDRERQILCTTTCMLNQKKKMKENNNKKSRLTDIWNEVVVTTGERAGLGGGEQGGGWGEKRTEQCVQVKQETDTLCAVQHFMIFYYIKYFIFIYFISYILC